MRTHHYVPGRGVVPIKEEAIEFSSQPTVDPIADRYRAAGLWGAELARRLERHAALIAGLDHEASERLQRLAAYQRTNNRRSA